MYEQREHRTITKLENLAQYRAAANEEGIEVVVLAEAGQMGHGMSRVPEGYVYIQLRRYDGGTNLSKFWRAVEDLRKKEATE